MAEQVKVNSAVRFFDVLEIMADRLELIDIAREKISGVSQLPVEEDTRQTMATMHKLLARAATDSLNETLSVLKEIDDEPSCCEVGGCAGCKCPEGGC